MFRTFYSPNIVATGSSSVGEDSLSVCDTYVATFLWQWFFSLSLSLPPPPSPPASPGQCHWCTCDRQVDVLCIRVSGESLSRQPVYSGAVCESMYSIHSTSCDVILCIRSFIVQFSWSTASTLHPSSSHRPVSTTSQQGTVHHYQQISVCGHWHILSSFKVLVTDFFGSVRNIELIATNDTTITDHDLGDENEPVCTSQTCQSSLSFSMAPPSKLATVSCMPHPLWFLH